MPDTPDTEADWPRIRPAGFGGMLVSFGDALSEPANRAALAFRAAVEGAGWDGVEDCSTSLVSAFLRFDPLVLPPGDLRSHLSTLLASRNWHAAPLPEGRRLWRVPAVLGGTAAPQLVEAAALAGLTRAEAVASLTAAPVRVQTIGFAPGMPYLGALPEAWNIPRQTGLTPQVPAGAVAVAIRQLVLFPVATPTGWRHVAQTAFRPFRPEAEDPFVLRPGDEVLLIETGAESLPALWQDPAGGATSEALP